jgi:hypothetical protein
MTRHFVLIAALLAAAGFPLAAQSFSFNTGDASLDVTLTSINVQASAQIGPYTADLSATFGVAQPQIQTWITVDKLQPAEAYLVLEMGRIASKPPATVIEVYKKNRGKGWGAVARSLGIKPGSPEFKALKGNAVERDKIEKDRKGKDAKKR